MGDALPSLRICPRCRVALGSSVAAGLCPRCIGRRTLGLDAGDVDAFEGVGFEVTETSVNEPVVPMGVRIGPYTLRDELGRGAMGVVGGARRKTSARRAPRPCPRLTASGLEADQCAGGPGGRTPYH